MFLKEWEVLLVDDEPDVLSVSKLAMRNFEVYGLPLRLHLAQSKAEAVDILSKTPQLLPLITVAFIDVVMETDTAGLELCQYIREGKGNKVTQLFVRTGQPGIAPERAVIDRYDINGYFTKVEATEDKLYSLVKSGVRQWFWSWFSTAVVMLLVEFITASGSRAKLAEAIERTLRGFHMIGDRLADSRAPHGCCMTRDRMIAGIGMDERTALEVRDRLNRLEGTPLSPDGDKYVTDGNNVLIKVAAGPARAEVYLLFAQATFSPPPDIMLLGYQMLRGLAPIWHGAK